MQARFSIGLLVTIILVLGPPHAAATDNADEARKALETMIARLQPVLTIANRKSRIENVREIINRHADLEVVAREIAGDASNTTIAAVIETLNLTIIREFACNALDQPLTFDLKTATLSGEVALIQLNVRRPKEDDEILVTCVLREGDNGWRLVNLKGFRQFQEEKEALNKRFALIPEELRGDWVRAFNEGIRSQEYECERIEKQVGLPSPVSTDQE